jgi:hypothetical protein
MRDRWLRSAGSGEPYADEGSDWSVGTIGRGAAHGNANTTEIGVR